MEMTFRSKTLQTPVFLPDATRGVVRSVDSKDLRTAGVEAMVVNTFHLMQTPGPQVIKNAGGIKKFMNWDGVVVSDSGGFQMLSLIYARSSFGSVNDEGMTFIKETVQGEKKRIKFTPEKSIQVQFALGADVMICLDDCPPLGAGEPQIMKSVERTVAWAERCKKEFELQCKIRKLDDNNRPQLLGVIQGGDDKRLRKECAEGLEKIGFDGYGFGGWPVDEAGKFNGPIVRHTAKLMGEAPIKFALGIGFPDSIVEGWLMGYTMFDCVLPTRDARHKRLYVFTQDPRGVDFEMTSKWWDYAYIMKEKYVRNSGPLDQWCDCLTCTNYSAGYLKHLFEIKDVLSWRLATIHNLRFYTRLMEELRRR